MSILDAIGDAREWRAFFEYRTASARLTKSETRFFEDFINERRYEAFADKVFDCCYTLSPPQKKLISKLGSSKKRVVYSFGEDENAVLKLIAHRLSDYDGIFSPCCYSFRRGYGAKNAVKRMTAAKNIAKLHGFKLDISNYFNSIDCSILLSDLRGILKNDPPLLSFFERLLTLDRAVYDGEVIAEKRGAMAGTPVSPFFANVYLMELDKCLYEIGALYARYSDDIIVFAKTEAELAEYKKIIFDALAERGLSVNPEKQKEIAPHEAWEFLGVEYRDGSVDIAPATIKKLFGKIRRKARSLYRWKIKTGATDEHAMRVFARVMNKKFFDNDRADEMTWARWYFPLINSTDGLSRIDSYLRENMRFVASGDHRKKSMSVRYEQLKELGLVSLVNAYYKYCDAKRLPKGD